MSEGVISGGIVGGIISGFIATSLFTKLSSPNLKINIDEEELDIQDDKTMHVRVRNDKRFCIVNTAYECTGYMCIYFKKQYSKNYIVNRLRGPYILKWTNLPPSDYKRAETIIDIPNDIKEKFKLGRQLDLFRVKAINNENYIIIQDPQQQASRNIIIQNYKSVIQQCCPQCNKYLSQNLPALVAVD
ncbi:MAG: hypothetical protein OWQ50_02770, partial [Acidianus infernus]|nr:hypothetical protein [Acidianus infernus]